MKKDRTRRATIRSFEDFVEESKMLPDGHEPDIHITDPLEQHFMLVAQKHGIIDAILYGDYDE